MDHFIARANIDHCLGLLKDADTPPGTRATVVRILIEEEKKLGYEREQLDFAESRLVICRERVEHQRQLTETFEPGSPARKQAEQLLLNFKWIARIVECATKQMRWRVKVGQL